MALLLILMSLLLPLREMLLSLKQPNPLRPAAASGTSGIVVLDCNTTNHFTITTSGNITGWNFTNASPGQRIIVRVTNGASHTVAFFRNR